MADLLILAVGLPGVDKAHLAGFILTTDDMDACEAAFRHDWTGLAPEEEAEVLSGYEETFQSIAAEKGAAELVAFIEETLSNTVRFVDRLFIPSRLPLKEHAALLRRGLLG